MIRKLSVTPSVLGNFANGAATAAFSYAFSVSGNSGNSGGPKNMSDAEMDDLMESGTHVI